MSKWRTVMHVCAGKEEVDHEAIVAFRDRLWNRPYEEKAAEDPFYIPPWLDRRKG